MPDPASVEAKVVADASAVKAWYKRSSFWGQALAGALIYQTLRFGLLAILGWHA